MLKKSLLIYLTLFTLFMAGVALVIHAGRKLEKPETLPAVSAGSLSSEASERGHRSPPVSPTALLPAQIILVLACANLFGSLFKRLGQPAVMGEITAGLFLGPSLLGGFFPGYLDAVFPESSLGNLKILSQLGVIVFMFLTGMEIDTGHLKKHAHSAVLISHAGILFPFLLGTALSYFLYAAYAPPRVSFNAFALFMGIAMSITAFPVLAKILKEKKLSEGALGTTILGCAAADDVTAWTILAGIMALVRSQSPAVFLWSAFLSAVFVLFMLRGVKPFLAKHFTAQASRRKNFLPEIFVLLFTSSFITEAIGIHALFGAFLAGTVLPRNPVFTDGIQSRIGFLAHLLLPLFFALSGLKTQAGLIQTPEEWTVCALIIAVAILGKFGGAAAAARISGMNTRDSLIAGALMNTRGLMELIVLNIGLELGVLSPGIFTMMVLMALATTIMTSPLVDFFLKTGQKNLKNSAGKSVS